MRAKLITAAMLLCAATATAKDIRTVVLSTQPQMHCESCENRIKNNLRFEKGIKRIETDVEKQAVTITYDADKTNIPAIIKGFKKINYDATVREDCDESKTCCEQPQAGCTAMPPKCGQQKGCCGGR